MSGQASSAAAAHTTSKLQAFMNHPAGESACRAESVEVDMDVDVGHLGSPVGTLGISDVHEDLEFLLFRSL